MPCTETVLEQTTPTPVFLLGLPRSGTTLLQRELIKASRAISTISEPWFLLPLVYTYKNRLRMADYSVATERDAINYLLNDTNIDLKFYQSLIRNFALSIYQGNSTSQTKYFIDKTPRYYYILDDIKTIFPDAKFIVLARNPLAILSSHLTTFNPNFSAFEGSYDDLYEGPDMLGRFYAKNKNSMHVVHYEQLIVDPINVIKGCLDYLQVEPSDGLIGRENIIAKGLGDPNRKAKNTIVKDGLNGWKGSVTTLHRKRFFYGYINSYSDHYLDIFHYDRSKLLNEINAISPKKLFGWRDVLNICKGLFYKRYNLHLLISRRPIAGTYVS